MQLSRQHDDLRIEIPFFLAPDLATMITMSLKLRLRGKVMNPIILAGGVGPEDGVRKDKPAHSLHRSPKLPIGIPKE